MLNILEITTFLRGGAGVFVTRLSQALKEKGHGIHVISSGKVEELVDWDDLLHDLSVDGIDHSCINFFKRENPIFWNSIAQLASFLQEHEVDIIHSHAGVPALGAYLAVKMVDKSIPIVATFHSWSKERPEWMNIQDAWAFNQCKNVCYDSEGYRKIGEAFHVTGNTSVIYPGLLIDPQPYLESQQQSRVNVREKLGLPNGAKIISQLAEITERKGQLDLIKAMNAVLEKEPDTYLLLIGECRNPEYKRKLDELTREEGLQGRVLLPGWVEDPYELISASDVFAFPSYSEGLGMAIIEALALRVPAVFAYEEGMKDIADLLGEDNFGVFPAGDVSEIASSIAGVLGENPIKLNAQIMRASHLMQIEFSFQKTVQEYEHILEAVIRK